MKELTCSCQIEVSGKKVGVMSTNLPSEATAIRKGEVQLWPLVPTTRTPESSAEHNQSASSDTTLP